jgi:hypothetical protein
MNAGATAGGLKVLPEEYPDVKRSDSDFTESIHGTCVPDPYRWLEDPNSEETKQCAPSIDMPSAEHGSWGLWCVPCTLGSQLISPLGQSGGKFLGTPWK